MPSLSGAPVIQYLPHAGCAPLRCGANRHLAKKQTRRGPLWWLSGDISIGGVALGIRPETVFQRYCLVAAEPTLLPACCASSRASRCYIFAHLFSSRLIVFAFSASARGGWNVFAFPARATGAHSTAIARARAIYESACFQTSGNLATCI